MILFKEYWNLGDLQRQRDFLASNMTLIQPKYQYRRDGSHRQRLLFCCKGAKNSRLQNFF